MIAKGSVPISSSKAVHSGANGAVIPKVNPQNLILVTMTNYAGIFRIVFKIQRVPYQVLKRAKGSTVS